jgi:hypothetical protein
MALKCKRKTTKERRETKSYFADDVLAFNSMPVIVEYTELVEVNEIPMSPLANGRKREDITH